MGTDPQAFGTRVGRARTLVGLGLPSTERNEHVQGTYEDKAEDIDDTSDEDESTAIIRDRAPRGQ
jgi:hypothetical protein